MPRTPNPPGISTPSKPDSTAAAPAGVSQVSDATHTTSTRAQWANPPARSASVTDRYASGRSTYLPTTPIRTVSFGLCTRASRSPHTVQSTSRNGSPSRRTT